MDANNLDQKFTRLIDTTKKLKESLRTRTFKIDEVVTWFDGAAGPLSGVGGGSSKGRKMGQRVEIVTPLHTSTKRDYLARMNDGKVECMERSREYGADYWDGDRRFGYGGYKYDGRWKPLAEHIITRYNLSNDSRILDVGCGKAHLLYEIHQLLPGAQLHGFDPSDYGLADAPADIRQCLSIGRAEDMWSYQYQDKEFDLVLAMGSLHNLELQELARTLPQIERIGKQAYLWVESYDDAASQFGLMCWALTARAFYSVTEWEWLLEHFGYYGDREYVFFR